MANRKYTEKLKVSIECADKELPVAIAQLGQTIKIDLAGADMTLGNVQQLPQTKSVDLLPLMNRSSADIPTLPTGRRINHG
jgi:hypothetical protein